MRDGTDENQGLVKRAGSARGMLGDILKSVLATAAVVNNPLARRLSDGRLSLCRTQKPVYETPSVYGTLMGSSGKRRRRLATASVTGGQQCGSCCFSLWREMPTYANDFSAE